MTSPLSTPDKSVLLVSTLFGLLYLAIGTAWLVAPAVAAQALGASLLSGTGLATQLGDSAAFFVSAGAFMLYGAFRRSAPFLTAGAVLIGLVAPVRLLAWQVHGAALTIEPVVIEVLTFVVVLRAARAVREA